MECLSLLTIAQATQGKLNNDRFSGITVDGIGIDTRNNLAKSLFIAICGDRFDGHNYIKNAFDKGAVCVLVQEDKIQIDDKPAVYVEDTKQALMDLARYYRSLFDIPVVAVTGSTGKTTTKDIIHSVLSKRFRTLKNQGNLNNEIGLPLTVFMLDNTYEAAVLEMGMSGFGEIHNLSKIARPNISVITNIGDAHIEKLGSREGIFEAKTEIFDFMADDAMSIASGDDEFLKKLKFLRKNVVLYGTQNDNDFYASDVRLNGLNGVSFTLHGFAESFNINVPAPGAHMLHNAMAAAVVGKALGLTKSEIADGILEFRASGMRLDIFETKNGVTILNDAYNANPDSMKAAINVLKNVEGKTICILGDMLELGSHSPELHYELGVYAAEQGIDLIFCLGAEARHIYEGAYNKINASETGSKAVYFEKIERLLDELSHLDKCTVLVKASRGMGFEEIVNYLKG